MSSTRELALATCIALVLAALSVELQAQPRDAKAPLTILDTAGTMWRYYEVHETEVARLDSGELVRVDPYKPRQRIETTEGDRKTVTYSLCTSTKVTGSFFPPDDWRTSGFDDSTWMRHYGPALTHYRSLAMVCLRGKFQVVDPVEAGDLSLSVVFRGGAVVYLNGRELGRSHLPKGKIRNDTLAEDYPTDSFTNPDGSLIVQTNVYGQPMTEQDATGRIKDAEVLRRYTQRIRKLELKIPPSLLRKGTNVLAIEVHRAPAVPAMFTTIREVTLRSHELNDFECNVRALRWWNRASVDEVKLTAPAGAPGVVPNTTRPKGVQVWNHDVMCNVAFWEYGDPAEGVSPVRLCGARNGVCSGEVVISSAGTITGIKVVSTDLRQRGGAAIPASAVRFGYAGESGAGWVPNAHGWWVSLDAIETVLPTEVPGLSVRGGKGPAILPVWITVNIPRDARPGEYVGKVTVRAEGLDRPVDVPIHLHVSGWTLPDPTDFTTYMGIVQSPDSVALEYNVKMWSEEHWKLLDKTFSLLAQVGTKEIYIPLIRRTHFGNQHSMVRWIKQADGAYKHDFSVVERYIDTAVKHLGKVPVVCLNVTETGTEAAQGPMYTELDEKTGELKEAVGPRWGTPEAVDFLKPVFDGIRAILAKRGMESSMMVGMESGGGNGPSGSPQSYKDVTTAAGGFPQRTESRWGAPRWVRLSHYWFGDTEARAGRPNFGRVALVGGVLGVFWDVDEDKPIYGWQNPMILIVFPRTTNADYAGTRLGQESGLPEHRLCAEGVLTSGRRHPIVSWGRGNISGEVGYDKFPGVRGLGPFGADFWPVLKGARGNKNIIGRYGESYADGGWGTVSLNAVVQTLLAPGKDGPIVTARFQMLREACQEAEARIFVQNAIVNEVTRAKLGTGLAGRCKELCDERTRAFRYISEYWTDGIVIPAGWEERSRRLYDLAAEVAAALDAAK